MNGSNYFAVVIRKTYLNIRKCFLPKDKKEHVELTLNRHIYISSIFSKENFGLFCFKEQKIKILIFFFEIF